jgi:hypothetical protein
MQVMPELKEERRQHARFHVREGAYAFIDNIPFTIQDISEGGIKIKSAVFDDMPDDNVTIDVFVNNGDFYLRDVPARLVSFLQNEASTPFSVIRIRHFGLEFGELTDSQKHFVDNFITFNTVGEA